MAYKFYLQKDATTYYKYDPATGVTTTSVATPLQHWPDNWQEIKIDWNRHKKYHGVFKSVTTEISFVEDGYQIIRYLYETYGVEAYCNCYITKQNDQNLNWEEFYSGNVDFGKLKIEQFFCGTTLIEGGLKLLLEQNSGTDYEIPIVNTDPDYQNIYLDGIKMQGVNTFVPINFTFQFNTMVASPTDTDIIVPNAWISQEGDFPIATHQNQFAKGVYLGGANMSIDEFNDFMYLATQPQTIKFEIHQLVRTRVVTTSGQAGLRLKLVIVGNDQIIKSQNIVYDTGYLTSTFVNYQIDLTTSSFSLAEGDRVYLIYGAYTSIATTFAMDFVNFGNDPQSLLNNHSIYSDFRMPTTHAPGYNYIAFAKKMVGKMTNGANTAQSTFLSNSSLNSADCYPYSEIVTCGDAIRQLSNPIIKTNFDEMFDDLQAAFNCGIGIENDKIAIEPLSHFYDLTTQIADLGEVSNFTIEPALDLICNTLYIGYKDYNYDNLNGRYEYNTNFLWGLPILSNKQELNRISPYRPDVLGIEQLRANLSQKKTTDSSSDNDTFIIDCDPTTNAADGSRKVYRPTGTITGIPFPDTYYNFGRTPNRSVWRMDNYLHSILDKLDSKTITFQVTNKNKDLVTDFGHGSFNEDGNITISSFAAGLFKPIVYRFTAIPPVNIAALMATNPNGYFKFSFAGTTYTGFATTVGANLGTYNAYDFVLLATGVIS